MNVRDIRKLLSAIKEDEINEFVLETQDLKLVVRRGVEALPAAEAVEVASSAPSGNAPAPATSAPAAPAADEPAPAAAGEPKSHLVEVQAPIVGTFYSAPSPDTPPYVKVGDRVEPGTVLCIIEAMKLMNEIEAETKGTVAEVLVRNEEPVEYGQVLFRIDPD